MALRSTHTEIARHKKILGSQHFAAGLQEIKDSGGSGSQDSDNAGPYEQKHRSACE